MAFAAMARGRANLYAIKPLAGGVLHDGRLLGGSVDCRAGALRWEA